MAATYPDRSALGPQMSNLTDRALKALRLKPGQKDRLVFDTECPGLGVRLTAAGTRKLIEDWTQRHLVYRRARYAADAPRALRSAFADYLKKPAARLTRPDVITVL